MLVMRNRAWQGPHCVSSCNDDDDDDLYTPNERCFFLAVNVRKCAPSVKLHACKIDCCCSSPPDFCLHVIG
eukprot:6091120-Karenia_brevis.AAC.1